VKSGAEAPTGNAAWAATAVNKVDNAILAKDGFMG
jgi:hypothetical protein